MTNIQSINRVGQVLVLTMSTLVCSNAVQAQEYSEESTNCYAAIRANNEDALTLCQAAIDQGDTHAMFLVATRTRVENRRELLERAVKDGHVRSMATLALMEVGAGNLKRATELEMQAAKHGHGPSVISIAQRLRRNAKDDEARLKQARAMFLGAARAGYPAAQFQLAGMLAEGQGGDKNAQAAANWYREAAMSGHTRSQFRFGMLVKKDDPRQARAWFRRAARGGHSGAMVQLAVMQMNSEGGPRSVQLASYWINRAIHDGNRTAVATLQQVQSAIQKAAAEAPQQDAKPVDILKIQQILILLGYDPGPADGMMGDMTKKAITEFEGANSLPKTGTPTAAILARLEKALDAQ